MKSEEEKTGMLLILVLSFMLCIFEPFCIYFQNSREFIFDIYTLLPVCLVVWVIVLGLLFLVGLSIRLLVPRVYPYIVYMCFSLFVCLYIQGNYMAGALPLLDGSPVDWSLYKAQNVQSLLLWLGVFALLAIVFFRLKKDRFYKLVRVVSGVMGLVFIVTFTVTGYFNYGFERKPAVAVTDRNLAEYSDNRNVIFLIVDMLDVEYENIVFQKYPEDKEFLKDFTYYDNVVSGYCYTYNSLPFMLSGRWYEGKEKFDVYKEWCYFDSPFMEELKKQGYVLGMYTDELATNEAALQLENTVDIRRSLEHPVAFAGAWMKMVGYKYLPYPLKRYSQVLPVAFTDPFSSVGEEGVWDFYQSNKLFYTKHVTEDLTIDTDGAPRFKFIHIQGAHYPFMINRRLDFDANTTYIDCVEGTNQILKAYLERLKAEGVYDNSMILIMADHGTAGDNPMPMGHQDPVLFIKGFGETHAEMQTDSAPISQADYVDAYFKLLAGSTGDEVFTYKEGDVRERRCLVYQQGQFDEYIQYGHASDLSTFLPTGKSYLPYW